MKFGKKSTRASCRTGAGQNTTIEFQLLPENFQSRIVFRNLEFIGMREAILEIPLNLTSSIHPHHQLLDRMTHGPSEPGHHHSVGSLPSLVQWISAQRTRDGAGNKSVLVLSFKRYYHVSFPLMKVAFREERQNEHQRWIFSKMQVERVCRIH